MKNYLESLELFFCRHLNIHLRKKSAVSIRLSFINYEGHSATTRDYKSIWCACCLKKLKDASVPEQDFPAYGSHFIIKVVI